MGVRVQCMCRVRWGWMDGGRFHFRKDNHLYMIETDKLGECLFEFEFTEGQRIITISVFILHWTKVNTMIYH